MFNKLKEKLKSWISKNKEDEEEIVETKLAPTKEKSKSVRVPKKKEKKVTKKKEAKSKKEAKKKTSKKEKVTKAEEEVIEETNLEEEVTPEPEEIIEEPTKKETEEIAEDEHEKELEESLEETISSPVKEKVGLFGKFKKRLTEEKFEEMFEELQMILIQNNVAYAAVEQIKESLEEKLIGKTMKEVDLAKELKEAIESLLINPPDFLKTIKDSLEVKQPFIILFAGINGSGKTTTIAKVANYLLENKLSVCLAAADTFRAAAIQQLEVHANRLEVPIIKKDYGSDPASVGFDAISYAKKNKIDVVLIDTAGRMQNKDSLMQEIEKIERVNKPDMKIFLGESITGNDATEQAKAFNEAINITGIILSKADVDEKGGTAISVSAVTGKPILFLGTGQGYKDLEIFDKEKLIEKLGL